MIPLRDSVPRVHPSWAVWSLIAVNTAVFLYQTSLSPVELFSLVHLWGYVPARITDPQWAALYGYPQGGVWSLITHMFLHGGWMHLIMNMWMLWIFADNIEDIMGPWRFMAFYLLCGLAGVGLETLVDPGSTSPLIGASGAIAGVLGAYFLLYPQAKVLTLIILVVVPIFLNLPAFFYLALWFLAQILSGMSSLDQEGLRGVAWWAHAGGFVAGMGLVFVFRVKDRCYYCFNKTVRLPKKVNERFPPELEREPEGEEPKERFPLYDIDNDLR